jgi:NAD(P)-dependent dehydrogenase (short-subunit alcohol dehydrogenase family)
VFVTGGASGIGAAIVEHFAAQGARDLGGDNIRVNCAVPGQVFTERQMAARTPE